jgi:uncharacterized FlgJ-related protein
MKNKKFYIAKVLVIILIFVSYTHMVYEIASSRKMKETIKYIQVPKYYAVIDTVYLDAKKENSIHGSNTLSYVEEELKSLNIKFADIVTAQSIIESGSFTSDIYLKANNCFGMRLAKQRPTTAIGEYKGYAKYKNLRDCLIDYALWQQNNIGNINTSEQYLKLLERIYAEDKNYTDKINKTLK